MPKLPANDPVRRRIFNEIESRGPDCSYKSVSLAIGRNHAFIYQYLFQGSPRALKETDRQSIAEYLQIPEHDLLPPAQRLRLVAQNPELSSTINKELIDKADAIQEYDVRASAGGGNLEKAEKGPVW